MDRVAPHIHLHSNIWDHSTFDSNDPKIPILLRNRTLFKQDHFRNDYLIPNEKILIDPNVYEIDLLNNDQVFNHVDKNQDKTREEFLVLDRLFVLENVLTREECDDLINLTNDLGYHSIDREYSKEYRNSERVVVTSKKVAEVLWNRIIPSMKKEDVANVKPYGFDNNGRWIPIELNECLRFNRYTKGTFFKPHMDSYFAREENERSIFTILIYLNDSPFGTTFWKKIPGDTSETKMKFKKLVTVQPKAGSIAIFNHDIYHSGDFVTEDYKYVLRTEMIFKRIDPDSVYRQDYRESDEFKKVKQLIDESNLLENIGNVKLSTQKYIQAHEMQAKQSNSIQNVTLTNTIGLIPEEIFYLIFSYLKTEEISKRFITLDKNINSISRHSRIWKERYYEKWPVNPIVPLNKQRGFVPNYNFYYEEESQQIEEGPITSIENAIVYEYQQAMGDWYHAFITRSYQEKYFEFVLFDIDPFNYRFGLSSQSLFYVSPSSCGRVNHPHFSLVGYEFNSIVCGDRFLASGHYRKLPLIERDGVIVDYDNFTELITQLYKDDLKKTFSTPLLMSVPITWTESHLSDISQLLSNMGLDVIFVDEDKLRSIYYLKPNCLIIKLTGNGIYFTPVIENEVVRKFSHIGKYKNLDVESFPNAIKVAYITPLDSDNSELTVESVIINTTYPSQTITKEDRLKAGKSILTDIIRSISEFEALIGKWKDKNNATKNLIVVGEFAMLENMRPVLSEMLTKTFSNSSVNYIDQSETSENEYEDILKKGYRGSSFDVLGGAKIICSLSNFREEYYQKRKVFKKQKKSCNIT